MGISSQEPRGAGLSTSLVSDFRAIMTALEQQRGATPDAERGVAPAGEPSAAETVPAPPATAGSETAEAVSTTTPEPVAEAEVSAVPASPVPPSRPSAAERTPPKPLSEVRVMIAALGEVDGLVSPRPAKEVPVPAVPAAPAPVAAIEAAPRRRAFGAAACGEADSPSRRRKSASKDVITWQRLAGLVTFMAVIGAGASMLQSVVGREEAAVAPEAIGNAAIASVAPTQTLPMMMPPSAAPIVQAQNAAAPAQLPRADEPAPSAEVVVSDAVIGGMPGEGFAPALPASVRAFAPTERAESTGLDTAPSALLMQAPPPPVPAPASRALAAVERPPAERSQAQRPAAPPPVAVAPGPPFGGAAVGTVTIRRSVTMRAAPQRGAPAIGNISSGRTVDLVACTRWCEVIVDGKRGFIYKSFVGSAAPKDGEAQDDGEDEAAAGTP